MKSKTILIVIAIIVVGVWLLKQNNKTVAPAKAPTAPLPDLQGGTGGMAAYPQVEL
jgi:flagellar biogenesis protein FliO